MFLWLIGMMAGGTCFAVNISETDIQSASKVTCVSDVEYLPVGRSEKLDVYLPDNKSASGLHPAVVYFHGGGWHKGDKADPRELNIAHGLAAEGFVVFSVNYFLGDHSWPKNLEDCRAALRFVRLHSERYQIDPQRIALMGASAGGHLALLVGFTDKVDVRANGSPGPVRAIIDLYGITNLLSRRRTTAEGLPTDEPYDSFAPKMLGATRTENSERYRLASPVSYITPTAPPVLIVHGLSDQTVDFLQSVELANRLREQGVHHKLLLLEGVGHQFDLLQDKGKPLPVDLTGVIVEFLQASSPSLFIPSTNEALQ